MFFLSAYDPPVSSHFKGYAFTGKHLVIGEEGYKQFFREQGSLYDLVEDGRFVLVEKKTDCLYRLRTDPSGQCILYYYTDDEYWVVAESLMDLAKGLSAAGKKITPYQPAIDVFNNERLSLIGGQLVSNNTALKGVRVLGLNEEIQISGEDLSKISVLSINSSVTFLSYEEFLYKYIASWKGRLKAISELPFNSYLSLSGGVDSRAVLALWSAGGPSKKINCHSHKRHVKEYEIARKICGMADGIFDSGLKGIMPMPLTPEESFNLSMLGNAGVKTNFGFRRIAATRKQLHFIGGSAIGSFYMKSSFSRRAKRLTKKYGSAGENVANEISVALNELGLSEDDPWAMFHHYYNFRARYHYGNDAYTRFGAVQVHPLLDPRFHRVSELVSRGYVEGNGVVRDVISFSNCNLLNVEFDSPTKVKSKEKSKHASLETIPADKYTAYFDENESYNFATPDFQKENISTGDWLEEMSAILKNRKEAMVEFGVSHGFSDDFIKDSVAEVDNYKQKSKLKKAGVLLGMSELLFS